jgi:glycosyltransferase involved in cell wall biosynthesis
MCVDALPITLCISTRNAAAQLAGCIESVRPWVSEIVVVDMESSDQTLEIARSYGAKVVQVPAAGWAEPGRQSGIDAATQPWILVLDADERAGDGLAAIAADYVRREDVAGVQLPRQNFQFGWWVPGSGIWPDWQLRLFRTDKTTWPAIWTHLGAVVDGPIEQAPAQVENAIIHHSFASIRDWITATNRYTDHEAQRAADAGRGPSLIRLFAVPAARFFDAYIAKRGYRSGRYGLSLALMSFCYWMLAELKLWERGLADDAPTRDSVRQAASE